MIWLKIITAAVMSGSLFALVETVLPPRPPQPFTLQVSDWPGDQVFALIEPLGIDLGGRVHLDIRRTAPGRDPVDAFRGKLADGVLIDLARLPELIGDDIRLIYAFDEVAGGGGLVAGAGFNNAAALRGRSIGVAFGNAARTLVLSLLDRAGLDPGEVTLVPLTPEAAEAALRNGQVAAVAALAPSQIAHLEQVPGATLVASTQDVAGLVTHVLVVHEGSIPEQRDRIAAVLHALDHVAHSCRTALAKCLEVMATVSGRPATAWRQEFEAVHLLDLADNRGLLTGGNEAPVARRLALAQILAKAHHSPPTLPPPMDWVDPSLVQEAERP